MGSCYGGAQRAQAMDGSHQSSPTRHPIYTITYGTFLWNEKPTPIGYSAIAPPYRTPTYNEVDYGSMVMLAAIGSHKKKEHLEPDGGCFKHLWPIEIANKRLMSPSLKWIGTSWREAPTPPKIHSSTKCVVNFLSHTVSYIITYADSICENKIGQQHTSITHS